MNSDAITSLKIRDSNFVCEHRYMSCIRGGKLLYRFSEASPIWQILELSCLFLNSHWEDYLLADFWKVFNKLLRVAYEKNKHLEIDLNGTMSKIYSHKISFMYIAISASLDLKKLPAVSRLNKYSFFSPHKLLKLLEASQLCSFLLSFFFS